jgi:WD40 repeat protein/tRNA A-37 threonylcarbamoyl transferase component Bud32
MTAGAPDARGVRRFTEQRDEDVMPRECPSHDELVAFHLGTLPDHKVDAVAEHLEICAECESLLERLDTSVDQVVAVLRKPLSASAILRHEQSLGAIPAAPARPGEPDLTAPEHWPALPGYEVLGPLGRGGMGVVYQARQLRLNRLVALKRLRSGNPRELARFRAEAEALARVQHPNIVQIYEVPEHDGRAYLALELVEGGALGKRLGKPQAPVETARLLEAIARAVHHAHTQGIVHRDLKPANILLALPPGTTGDDWQRLAVPKITDFGVAKRLSEDSGETREGDVIGTPAYMSPEQATGKTEGVGPATDIYSLGVILYELLTGRVPLLGPSTLDTLVLVRTQEPVSPRRLQPRIARDLETICLKCLEKEPGRRYASAAELADDLRRFQDNKPTLARPTPAWERLWKWARRQPVVAALSGSVVLVTVLGFALVAWQWRRAEDEAAREAAARADAQTQEQKEKEARRESQRLSAGVALSQGVTLCEAGETGRGLLWLARSLDLAVQSHDADLERVARSNLAAWEPFVIPLRARCPHDSWCWAVAFSPDSRLAATGGFDYVVRLWDTTTGQPRGQPLKHDAPIWAVAFSPDGRTLLSGSGGPDKPGGEGRLWDVDSGRPLPVQLPHGAKVGQVAFRPDGQAVLTVGTAEARLWKTADGTPLAVFRHGPADPPRSFTEPMTAAFSPDGTLVATGGMDGAARFWDADTGEPRGKPLQTGSPVLTLAFSPDGRTLLTGSFDNTAQLWDVATRRPRSVALKHQGRVKAVAFSPDGAAAATAGVVEDTDPDTGTHLISGGEVRLWRSETGRALGTPLAHPAPVWAVAFSPGGRMLLTGSEDSQARFFLVATGAPIGRPLVHEGLVRAVAFSPDGKVAMTTSAGGGAYQAARLWELPAETALARPLMQRGRITALAYSPDGRYLLTGAADPVARLWDLADGTTTACALPAAEPIAAVAFAPDGKTFVTGSLPRNQGSVLRLWDRAEGRVIGEWHHSVLVSDVSYSADGRTVLAGFNYGPAALWKVTTRRKVVEMLDPPAGEMWSPHFAPDGRSVLAGAPERIRLVDLATGEVFWKRQFPASEVVGQYLPDGKRVLLLVGHFAQVWDPAGDRLVEAAAFHPGGGLASVLLHPDGRIAATIDRDQTARLWDVATGKPLGPTLGYGNVGAVALRADGKVLACGGRDGRITLWRIPTLLEGSPERVRLWVETLTGLELNGGELVRELSPEALEQRRRQLQQLGGPPTLVRD